MKKIKNKLLIAFAISIFFMGYKCKAMTKEAGLVMLYMMPHYIKTGCLPDHTFSVLVECEGKYEEIGLDIGPANTDNPLYPEHIEPIYKGDEKFDETIMAVKKYIALNKVLFFSDENLECIKDGFVDQCRKYFLPVSATDTGIFIAWDEAGKTILRNLGCKVDEFLGS